MRRLVTFGAVGLLGLGTLAACGDDDDDADDVSEANTEFCADLASYGTALENLTALEPTATKGEYEDAIEEVRSTHEAMRDSAADLTREEWETLEDEAEALGDQLREAPDDQAVAGILEAAEPQATRVQASAATVGTAICPTGGSTTTGTST